MSIDLTIAICALAWFGFLGMLWYVVSRCSHDWQPLVERELPSVSEVLGQGQVNTWWDIDLKYRAGRRKVFAIIGCKKCGKTKIFETLSGAGR